MKLKKDFYKITKNKKAFFWGASYALGDVFRANIISKENIKGIIDKDKTKTKYYTYTIYSPEQLAELNPEIIIASAPNHKSLKQEIENTLQEQKIKCKVINLSDIIDHKCNTPRLTFAPKTFWFKSSKEKIKKIIEIANNLEYYPATIPSMLTTPEKNLLHLIAKYYYKGIGSIFDAGIFLGGCSEALLNGLAENKRIKPQKQLWAYDLAKAPKDDRYWN